MKILTFLMTMCISAHTQDIVKHGITFKHENSLLTSNNAWKIFMKLDPKPFETLFQQVIRLEKNTYDLKESIFQFLKSDKGLQASKSNHKENKDIPSPAYPKIKIKKIVDNFDAKLADSEKPLKEGKRDQLMKTKTQIPIKRPKTKLFQ